MATSASTVIAAAAARARREIAEHFEKTNAYSPNDAVAFEPSGPMQKGQWDSLVGRGVARSTGDGRYWIDREAQRLDDERRRAAAILILKIVLAVTAVLIAVAAIISRR
jgi:hypothetical protein